MERNTERKIGRRRHRGVSALLLFALSIWAQSRCRLSISPSAKLYSNPSSSARLSRNSLRGEIKTYGEKERVRAKGRG